MKEEMRVSVKQLRRMADVKKKMYTTMNDPNREPRIVPDDHTLNLLLIGTHSPINIAMFEVEAYVPGRVHSHMRTHRDIQHLYWCGSSRKELPYGKEHIENQMQYRYINFEIGIDGLIHICKRRLCPTAHVDVRFFVGEMRRQVVEMEPILEKFLVRPCVWTGFCTEPRKDCGYIETWVYHEQRTELTKPAHKQIKMNRGKK